MKARGNMYQELFRSQEEVFKVIANQKRLEIIRLLSGREMTVTEMAEMLGIRQANVSQHLALLRQAGILNARRRGVHVWYSLADERVSEAVGLVWEFLQEQHKGDLITTALGDDADLYPVVQDVVCGMRISMSRAGDVASCGNDTYYFCAAGCKEKFKKAPEAYVCTKEEVRG